MVTISILHTFGLKKKGRGELDRKRMKVSLEHLNCGMRAQLSISSVIITLEREKNTVKMNWTKCVYRLLHKGLLFLTACVLTIRRVLRIIRKNEMTAAKGILRLTNIIALPDGGKFRNNLIFSDLRVVKVMCSVSGKGIYCFVLWLYHYSFPTCQFIAAAVALAWHLEAAVGLFCADKVALRRMP